MATYQPPKRGAEYIFYVGLVSQADTKLLKGSATLAAGDVQVSKDGGAFANLTTLPAVTPAAGKAIKVTLSATEMTADNVTVVFSDAAGAEWCDLIVNIATAARQIDDLATQTSVDTIDNLIDTEIGTIITDIAAVQADTDNIQTRLPAALVGGRMDSSVGAAGADTLTASALAADAANEIADAIINRNISGGSSTGRTVKQALHFLRNKWSIGAGTLTVTDTDDTTTSWTATVSTTAGDPVSTVDPA